MSFLYFSQKKFLIHLSKNWISWKTKKSNIIYHQLNHLVFYLLIGISFFSPSFSNFTIKSTFHFQSQIPFFYAYNVCFKISPYGCLITYLLPGLSNQLPDATPDQIKKAYYNCMKSCHPDLSGNDPETTNFCMFINEVYAVGFQADVEMIQSTSAKTYIYSCAFALNGLS